MSYQELAQHAARLEQSAVVMDMRQRGFHHDNGRFSDANLTDEAVQGAVDATVARFAGVADMFTAFLGMPDPDAFVPLRDTLAQVATGLNSGQGVLPYNSESVLTNPHLGKIDDVKGLVKDWYGGAALNFKDNFLSTWYPVTSNQFALVIALKGGVEAEAALWEEARKNVDDLAHKAQASLDAMLDCNPKNVAFLVTVAGAIFSVGASVASGGLAIGLTIVGEAASSAAAVPTKDPENQLTLTFREGLYQLLDDADLGRRLGVLATLLWAARTREYQRIYGDVTGDYSTGEETPISERDIGWQAERDALEVTGSSADGRITVRSVGMRRWQVTVRPGTVRTLNEQRLSMAVGEAAGELIRQQFAGLATLSNKYYGDGR